MAEADKILLDRRIGSTLERLVERFSADAYRGAQIDLWVFDGLERRSRATNLLAGRGVAARIRSAYKPLVHAFLEEIDLDGVSGIVLRYPVIAGVAENRFLLEAYPLTDLVGARPVTFEQAAPGALDGPPLYCVELARNDGRVERILVAAPNRFHMDPLKEMVLSSTGWLRIRAAENPDLDCDQRIETDQEAAFQAVMSVLEERQWPDAGACFERLTLRVEAPFYDCRLGAEAGGFFSTAEAMHEDLYFSALEFFKAKRGLAAGDRTFQPGRIVPQIVTRQGPVRVRITLGAEPPARLMNDGANILPPDDLATAGHWLQPEAIKRHLDGLGGDAYQAVSRRGRPVWGTHIPGPGPQMVISAGQHANETSGPIGALRAAQRLKRQGAIGFAVSALENPDGFALFREFCAVHPEHMHHAARYTAGGGDLEYVARGFENEIRHLARAKTGADVHLNLHGYPAHEWTRPFTGYVPRGFETWTIPKGFFLILRTRPGWKALGDAILRAIVDDLADYEPLVALNRAQLSRYLRYVPAPPFEIRKDIPVFASEVDTGLFPVTIITEAPDETIYGPDFIVAHTAQMRAVLAAAAALAAGAS